MQSDGWEMGEPNRKRIQRRIAIPKRHSTGHGRGLGGIDGLEEDEARRAHDSASDPDDGNSIQYHHNGAGNEGMVMPSTMSQGFLGALQNAIARVP